MIFIQSNFIEFDLIHLGCTLNNLVGSHLEHLGNCIATAEHKELHITD